MPSGEMTYGQVTVPAQYVQEVNAAAAALGIPAAVVASQIDEESSFDPQSVSPTGAEGIAQFEPGTWAQYGSGSPFDPAAAFAAYIKYMKTLLQQEGGNVYKALEAYNAGPGNLGAGSGYASTILTRAEVPATTTAGTPTTTGGVQDTSSSATGWPGEIVGFFSSAATDLETVFKFWLAFFQPSTYIRIASGLFGTGFLVLGVVFLAREAREAL